MHNSATPQSWHVAIDGRMAEAENGGVSGYIRQLSAYLIEQGWQVSWIVTRPPQNPPAGIKIAQILGGWHWLVWEQIGLALMLRRLKPDVYHAAANYGLPLFGRLPTILTIHDLIPTSWPGYFRWSRWPWLARQLYLWRLSSSCQAADRIICTNHLVARQLLEKKLVNHNRLNIIPMGVEPQLGQPIRPAEKKLLQRYHLTQPYLLAPGGLAERKHPDLLLKAFSLILQHQPKLTLIVTGSNPALMAKLQKLAGQLKLTNSVFWLGSVGRADLIGLIKQAAVIVYPTAVEGFGLPVVEAVAAKKPIITTDLPIFRELVGEWPSYIKKLTAQNLSQAILQSLRSRRIHAKPPIKLTLWQSTCRQTHQVYQNLLADLDSGTLP